MKYLTYDINDHAVVESLSTAPQWRKSAQVMVRVAEQGEALVTVLKDQTVETSRILDGGEIIVKNPSGEEYAISEEKFHNLYEASDKDGVWLAKGVVRALPNPTGKPIQIMAPWGEPQYGNENCFLVQGAGDDRYIIGHDEFKETYQPM